MVRHCIFEIESAEPAIRQVQMHLFAQPPLGANAEAVADDQHADHQLRINRWTAGVAVERREVWRRSPRSKNPVDAAQQVIARDVIVKVEGVEELVLRCRSLTHHLDASRRPLRST